jgi:hypothetical protein
MTNDEALLPLGWGDPRFSPWLRQGVALRGTTPAGMVADPLAEPGAETMCDAR